MTVNLAKKREGDNVLLDESRSRLDFIRNEVMLVSREQFENMNLIGVILKCLSVCYQWMLPRGPDGGRVFNFRSYECSVG